MTPSNAHKAILQRMITTWHTLVGGTQAAPTVPYAIDNRQKVQAATFAQVSIVNLNGDQVTMGREGFRRFERSGFIDVRLFGPRDQGRDALDTLAEHVIAIFESRTIGGAVRTYGATITEVRDDREFPDLWCLLVRVPFEYHQRR